jgi:hypothetical protein
VISSVGAVIDSIEAAKFNPSSSRTRSRIRAGDVGFAATRQSWPPENASRCRALGSAARTSPRERRQALTQNSGVSSHGARK